MLINIIHVFTEVSFNTVKIFTYLLWFWTYNELQDPASFIQINRRHNWLKAISTSELHEGAFVEIAFSCKQLSDFLWTVSHWASSANSSWILQNRIFLIIIPGFIIILGILHGMIERFGLNGTLQIISFPPPCHGQRQLPLDQVAQCPIQPGLGHCQGGVIHTSSGQPVPVPHHPQSEEFLSSI